MNAAVLRIEVGRSTLTVNLKARLVRVDGELVPLARLEYGLLALMATEPDRCFTKEALMHELWPSYEVVNVHTRTIESHVSRLRMKLRAAGIDGLFANVWGLGYRLLPAELVAA